MLVLVQPLSKLCFIGCVRSNATPNATPRHAPPPPRHVMECLMLDDIFSDLPDIIVPLRRKRSPAPPRAVVVQRIRSKPIMRAMYKMGLAGRVWVEAGHDCKKWVDIDIPACDANSPASVCITAYMGKKQRAPAQFAMVVVK